MVRKPVRILPQAEAEIADIYNYISRTSYISYADKVVDNIRDTIKKIEIFPKSGSAKENLAPGLRQQIAGRYLIFYQERETETVVLHVLHSARDVQGFFTDDTHHH